MVRNMKIKTKQSPRIIGGIALALIFGNTSQAEPPPDLLNSITWMRQEAQKSRAAKVIPDLLVPSAQGFWSITSTRNISAGQSVVAIPVFTHGVAPMRIAPEFKLAPLPQPNSLPVKK